MDIGLLWPSGIYGHRASKHIFTVLISRVGEPHTFLEVVYSTFFEGSIDLGMKIAGKA